MGFVLNRYDPCVANGTINDEQCTICWYVDDCKISHKNKEVVSQVINKIEESFGKMKVTRAVDASERLKLLSILYTTQ